MDRNANSPGASFQIISYFLLAWGLAYAGLVIFSFFVATPEDSAALVADGVIKQEYADYIANIPAWVVAVSIMAAITRVLGALGLLLRRAWALPCYVISLISVVIIMFRGFVLAGAASVIRPSQIGVEIVFMLLSIFAVWFAANSKARKILH